MPILAPRDQTVELLVKATSDNEARQITTTLAGYTLRATLTNHSPGYYIVSDSFSLEELNGDFYSKVKAAENLAILSDTSQKIRRDDVLTEVEKVENCLRKLLLRANSFIEDYYNLFLKPYTQNHAEDQTAIMAKSIDPITSLLTFEGMLAILGQDISWAQLTINGPQDILKLIEGIDDLSALRDKLKEKVKAKTVWEVISESILVKQNAWAEAAGNVNKIKDLRNRAAHFQVLTNKDVAKAKKLSKNILSQIGNDNQKPQAQISYVELPDFAKWIAEQVKTPAFELSRHLAAVQLATYQQLQTPTHILRDALQDVTANARKTMLSQVFPIISAIPRQVTPEDTSK